MAALIKGFVNIRYAHICQNYKRNVCLIESLNAIAQGTCSSLKKGLEPNEMSIRVMFVNKWHV